MVENISGMRKIWFKEQVEKLKASGISYAEIAGKLGVVPQYLNGILNGERPASEKMVSKLCDAYDINLKSLFNRIKGYDENHIPEHLVSQPKIDTKVVFNQDGIPLIPIDAVAGFAKGDGVAMEYDIAERYLVPEFSVRGVKYLIRVSGSSMYPKYSNGDILACRPVTDLSFFQWGKVYVLDTDQGALVKRLFEGKDDAFIECRSDNKEHYPAFQIPKTSIRSISIVVGVIRLD
jgi:transcriptional regulator with XRE-family HTH domain